MRGCGGCSNKARALAAAAAVALWAGAAGAAGIEDRLRLLQREDGRVAAIFLRLARAGAPFCPGAGPQAGLVLHGVGQYAVGARAAAARLFGLDGRAGVLAIVSGGAADRAGLEAGDALAAVNGVVPGGTGSGGRLPAAVLLEAALRAGPATVTIVRGGEARTVRLAADTGCDARVQLVPTSGVFASADGERIDVSTGLVEAAGSDDGLAFVIAHELAHLAAGPPVRRGRAAEADADALGLRIAARAGYDPLAAARTLARLATARGQAGRIDFGHPGLDRRLAALRVLATRLKASAP